MSNIGENIRQLRKLAGMTQAQLADEIGRTRAAISQYESGMIIPRMGVIEDLARALRVSASSLIGEAEISSNSSLASDESELLRLYRQMGTDQRFILLSTARTFAYASNA